MWNCVLKDARILLALTSQESRFGCLACVLAWMKSWGGSRVLDQAHPTSHTLSYFDPTYRERRDEPEVYRIYKHQNYQLLAVSLTYRTLKPETTPHRCVKHLCCKLQQRPTRAEIEAKPNLEAQCGPEFFANSRAAEATFMNHSTASTAATNATPPQPKPIRFVTNHDGPYAKRRRINSACLTCRRRKTRCSGEPGVSYAGLLPDGMCTDGRETL